MTSNTLRKALNKNSATPDADGLYTTRQITYPVFGGLSEAKLATQRPLTRKYELENSIVEASVLNKAALEAGFSQLADAMVHRNSSVRTIPRSKEDLLRELASVPIILENVARSQTRLRRSKNGQTANEEDASIS